MEVIDGDFVLLSSVALSQAGKNENLHEDFVVVYGGSIFCPASYAVGDCSRIK